MNRPILATLAVVLLLAMSFPGTVLGAVPEANNDSDTIAEDSGPDVIAVLANDNSDAGTLVVTGTSQPTHGTASTDGSTVTYTPDADYNGPDSFTYDVSNDDGGSSATVDITVTSVNDHPVAVTDDVTINEDTTTDFDVLANDTDVDDGNGALTILGNPGDGTHGTTTVVSGKVRYNPDADYHGSDSFTYTVSDGHGGGTDTGTVNVTIDPVNDPPVAHNDSKGVVEDTTTTLDIVGNDDDVDGDTLHVASIDSGPSKGNVTITNGGDDVSYDPDPNATGADGFTYTVSDGHGGTDSATVSVTISAVNDPPVANDDSATVTEDTPEDIDVLANDSDPDTALAIASVTQGAKGSVTNNGGDVTYSPGPNQTGADSFTYTLAGSGSTLTATVTVTIDNTNDPPVAGADAFSIDEDETADLDVRADDTDADGDAVTITDPGAPSHGAATVVGGKIHYVPTANYHGSDTFTYAISDGHGGSSSALVTVTIASVNDAPVADDDDFGVAEDAPPTTLTVLAGDVDPDGDAITITAKTNGTKGIVAIASNHLSVTYKPNANAFGSDTFTYTISDGVLTDTATVTVDIGGDNDPPNAVNDPSMSVPQGAGPRALGVLSNDTDPDGDTLTIIAKTSAAHGTVSITGGGTGLTYNPSGIYKGTDTFKYTVSDGHGGTDLATVVVTVVEDTIKPIAVAPTIAFFGQTAGTTTTKVRVSWSGSDTGGTGVASYKLQVSVNGGSYSTISLSHSTSTSYDKAVTSGKSYRFRVRATDKEGNVGSYAYSPTIHATRYSEATSKIAYVGSWGKTSTSHAIGGHTLHASSATRRAIFSFTGTDVAWIATRYTSSGKAEVFVDGVLISTVDLDRSSTAYRQLVFRRHFLTLAPHTLEIHPLGDGRVDVDAFVILQ